MNKKRLGVALCGSYCTYGKLFPTLEGLAEEYELVPIMSDTAAETDSRFGTAAEHLSRLSELCKAAPVTDIVSAEPLGPALPMDALLIAPCTEHNGKACARDKRFLGHDGGEGAPAKQQARRCCVFHERRTVRLA